MNITINGSYDIDDPASGNFTVAAHDIHYVFPTDSPLGGVNIIEALKELMELVDGILEAFQRMVEVRLGA